MKKSTHAAGFTVDYAGARASCAQCHSNEGYIDFMERGSTNPAGYYGLGEPEVIIDPDTGLPELGDFGEILYSNNPVPVVSPITCTTCHGLHKSFDFENDGNDCLKRT